MKNNAWLIIPGLVLFFAAGCKKDNNTCNMPAPVITRDSVVGNAVFLSWTNVDPAFYQLQFKPGDSVNWQTMDAGDSFITLSNLLPNTNYLCKVGSLCANYAASYGNTFTFRTGNILGSCSFFDGAVSFYASSVVASPANKSLTAYAGDTSTYVSFVFSTYPTSSSTYLIVPPGSTASGNTAVMTAKFQTLPLSASTGTDGTYANVTVTNGKISLTASKVTVANVQTSDSSGVFTNIIINQP